MSQMPKVTESGPTLLGTVRIARGLTQNELAKRTGISQGVLSKAESGVVPLDEARLSTLAQALRVPTQLVATPVAEAGASAHVFHRKRSTLPISTAKRLRAVLDLCHIQVAGVLHTRAPQVRLARMPLPEDGFDSPEDVARNVRQMLDLPEGAAVGLIAALELAGIVVIQRPLGSVKIDAIVSWPEGRRPLILLSDHAPADRQRFTIAHELAHAVMHQVPTEEQESEADRFASEFLMPSGSIRPQLDDLTIPKLVRLKMQWGVSMAALLRRGRDLGAVSDSQYRALNIELSRAGYRKNEPVQVPRETPTLMTRIIKERMGDGETIAAIAKSAQLSNDEFAELYLEGIA